MDNEFKICMAELVEYMGDQGWSTYPLPNVKMNADPQMTGGILAPTGHYDPTSKAIVLFIANRHPKDILRSFTHEMRHHHQNLTGMLNMDEVGNTSDPNYAQNNKHLRSIEEDAFLKSNMLFRDWADKKKHKK